VRYTGFHAKEVWISKYCSDSREVESHREKYLVNDILLMGRYLDAPISPMTLPMVKDNQLFLDTLNIRGAQVAPVAPWRWKRSLGLVKIIASREA